jgi:predicted Fe-Mo cluster-binding NifX family protein
MKIAVITEDSTTISKHFGRAPYYMVVTIEDGKIVNKERRDKAGHHTFGDHPHEAPAAHGERHGYDAESQNKHVTMASAIADCKTLVAGGMGWGAYDSLKSLGIETIITDIDDIEEAVKSYIQGTLSNLASERLH